jgi:hypothetical protein
MLRQRFRRDPTLSSGPILSSRISTGALDKIHRLHEDVMTNQISPHNAVQEVLRTFRSSGEQIDPNMISQVERAFNARHLGRSGWRRFPEGRKVKSLFEYGATLKKPPH